MLKYTRSDHGIEEVRGEGEPDLILERFMGGVRKVLEYGIAALFDEITTIKFEPIRKPGAEQATVGGVVAAPIQDNARFRKIPPIPVEGANLVGDTDPAPVFAEVSVAWITGQLLFIEVVQQLVERVVRYEMQRLGNC